ncbi:hypothetical protein AB0K88_24240 [Streptomyces werraensis]|uniref:hypothetical protein n=1 Tax=Streptomyces werraensis TaxID=68284 RepID=UPI0034373091
MITTKEAARRARHRQRLAPVGTNDRKAAGVAAVLLEDARTHTGARRLLDRHPIPEPLRSAVVALLAELAAEPEEPPAP